MKTPPVEDKLKEVGRAIHENTEALEHLIKSSQAARDQRRYRYNPK